MKKHFYLLILVIFTGCTCSDTVQKEISQDKIQMIASENSRIDGELSLDYFSDDLSGLTYDYYLNYITQHEAPSAKGIAKFIKQADYHYFKSQKSFFVIALYYKDSGRLIVDNSNTQVIERDTTWGNSSIPDLAKIAADYLK